MFESSLTQSLKTEPKMTRKVRVIFQDPYATDSSSSEDECEVMTPVKKPQKSKPIVREISLPVPGLPQAIAIQSESSSQDSNSRFGTNRKRVMSKSPEGTPKPKKPTGIRQRKWGKWAVEIRSPIDKKRVWVGTYLTLEEATEAYNAKKLEFETILAASSGKTGIIASSAAAASKNESASSTSEESESVVSISHTSPSAVPEVDTSASAPMLINDVTIDPIPECFDTNFDGIPISDIFFADEPLFPGSVDLAAQFDDFVVSNDFESLLGDYCGIEDLNISGIQGDEPSDLPDYDFNTDEFLLAADAPLNIACL